MTLAPSDIESLERATLSPVAPPEVLEIDGWLVPLEDGPIGRAKSAVPLRHDLGPQALDAIEAAYGARSLKPAFRVADEPGLGAVRAALEARGYRPEQPTVAMTAPAATVATFAVPFADLLEQPDEAWSEVFLGEGFDPEEGAFRARRLSQAPDALYGAVREGGRTVAVGVVSFGHGWAGVHGMRTAADQRGRGHAGAILAAFGRLALDKGVERVFLQVETGNPARGLYRKAGFSPLWEYQYWA